MRARGDGSSLIAAPARGPAKATMPLERCFRGTTRLGLPRAYFRGGTTIARQPYLDRKIQRKTGDHGHSNYAENHKPLRGRGQSLFDAGRRRRVRSRRQRHTARDGSDRLVCEAGSSSPTGRQAAYASPQGQGISGNFAFGSPPLNCPTGQQFSRVRRAGNDRHQLCRRGQCSDAFSMSGGGRWNAGSSQPAVSQFASKPLKQNTGLVGVFPRGCDNCTSRANPPQPAYEDCQSQPVCKVQRDATNSGGDVEEIFLAFLPN